MSKRKLRALPDEELVRIAVQQAETAPGRDAASELLGRHRDRVLPERAQVGMTQPFLKAYSELLIKTCHRRGAHAMGGMAAQIPISGDPDANEAALARVRADKLREVAAGHDGTWVAHPALIPLAREIFDELTTLSEKELKRSGEFVLPGMVKLVVQKRKARMGRNPATGEPIKIPAKTVVKARIAKQLKDAVLPRK